MAKAHAPIAATWGYENRTVALRIPSGPEAARRIEHRTAGADANPYLLLTLILGGILHGIESRLTPPDPITGNGYTQTKGAAHAGQRLAGGDCGIG